MDLLAVFYNCLSRAVSMSLKFVALIRIAVSYQLFKFKFKGITDA